MNAQVSLGAEGRNRLRAAIRAEIKRRGETPLSDISAMGRDALLSAARSLGLDIDTILAGAEQAPEQASLPAPAPDTADTAPDTQEPSPDMDTDTADTTAEEIEEKVTEIEVPPVPATLAEVEARVAEVLAPFAQADMAEFKHRLGSLADAALAGPKTIIRTINRTKTIRIEAPAVLAPRDGEAPHAQRIGEKTLRDLFGVSGRAGDVKLSIWQGPLSAKVDPAWRWNTEIMTTVGIALSRGRPVMLHGPRGTGKSSLAEQIAAATGREFVRVSCTDTTEAQELVGKHGPDGQGGIKWIDGQLTSAIRRPGCVILVDEPSVARAGAIMILQSVMDSARVLYIAETGERVPVAPGTVVMLADNTNGTGDATGAYEGTGRLNAATLDRPAVNVQVRYLAPGVEAAMVAQRTGCTPLLAQMLVEFAAKTREASERGEVVEGLSPRRIMSLAEQLRFGAPWELAWRDAVLNSATAADREHLAQMGAALVHGPEIERAAI